jgi:hypothetical protein
MRDGELAIAISSETLFAKSKHYIGRAIRSKEADDLDEYQLWASLALELLGKAALGSVHPSLIVDPTHFQSLFAAAKINISADIKTIGARTLFERLRHVVPKFEEPVKLFCTGISQRRNAELHSGEVPFKTMKLDAWEARFWHAAQLILNYMKSSLDDWLGAQTAKAPTSLLEHVKRARADAVVVRVEHAKDEFQQRKKSERDQALAAAEAKAPFHYPKMFHFLPDEVWGQDCPVCTGAAYLAGNVTEEEITDEVDPETGTETVCKYLAAEEFFCPVCGLNLEGSDEIEAAGLTAEHQIYEEREFEYEPDYGND